MNRKTLLLMVVIFLIALFFSEAEPSSQIQFLMDDSVSMLDWGMFKLENRLQGFSTKEVPNPWIRVQYYWETNRLVISLYCMEPIESPEVAKITFRGFVNFVRGKLGVVIKDGITVRSTALYSYFSHSAFQRKSEPAQLREELDLITEIEGSFFDIGKGKRQLDCKVSLIRGEIMYSEVNDGYKPIYRTTE